MIKIKLIYFKIYYVWCETYDCRRRFDGRSERGVGVERKLGSVRVWDEREHCKELRSILRREAHACALREKQGALHRNE